MLKHRDDLFEHVPVQTEVKSDLTIVHNPRPLGMGDQKYFKPGKLAAPRGGKKMPGDKLRSSGKARSKRGKGGRRPGDITVNAYDMAAKAWGAVKRISALINVEEKFFDVTSTINQNTTATINNLTNIAEGADYNNRDGNSILLQSISLSGICAISGAGFATFVRIIVFVDHDQRGTDPVIGDLLETTGASVTMVSPLLHYTAKRFSIIYDNVLALTAAKGAQLFGFQKKLHQHVLYSSTTGADASNWEGAIYILTVSNEATNTPTICFYNRLLYTDN